MKNERSDRDIQLSPGWGGVTRSARRGGVRAILGAMRPAPPVRHVPFPARTPRRAALAAVLAVQGILTVGGGTFRVEVGRTVLVSPGPIRDLHCDDGTLVEPVATPEGTAFRGLRAGRTACAFTNPVPVRVLVELEVVPAPPSTARPP